MNLQSFIELLTEKVSDILGPGYEVTSRRILKNNSVEYDCLSISHEKNNIAPSIQVDNLFLEFISGKSIDALADRVIRQYRDGLNFINDTDYLSINTDNAEEKIFLRLINYAKNEKLLESCPHERVSDLAVTYHYIVSNDTKHGLSTIRIDYSNMDYFKLTEASLRQYALRNTEKLFPAVFEKIEYLLKSYLQSHLPAGHETTFPFFGGIPMYVLTTDSRVNGAACLLYHGMLERIKKSIGSDFYIIPSSINEVLIVPIDAGMDADSLNNMLRSVNKEEVPDTEILSDNIYEYPKDSFQLRA